MSDENDMVTLRKSDLEKLRAESEQSVVVRRERIMAALLTGWLSDMEAEAAKRNVAHARKTADAIMEAAK